MKTNPSEEKIIEEFEEKFYFLVDNNDKHKEQDIKSFILSALSQARTEAFREIKDYLPEESEITEHDQNWHYKIGRNSYREDVKEKLDNLINKQKTIR